MRVGLYLYDNKLQSNTSSADARLPGRDSSSSMHENVCKGVNTKSSDGSEEFFTLSLTSGCGSVVSYAGTFISTLFVSGASCSEWTMFDGLWSSVSADSVCNDPGKCLIAVDPVAISSSSSSGANCSGGNSILTATKLGMWSLSTTDLFFFPDFTCVETMTSSR